MGLDDEITAAERKLREGNAWGDLVRLATLKERAGHPELSRSLGLKEPVHYENREKAVAFSIASEWVMERPYRSMNFEDSRFNTLRETHQGDFNLHLATVDIPGGRSPERIGLRVVITYRDSADKIESVIRRATEELTRREIEEARSPGPREPWGPTPRFA